MMGHKSKEALIQLYKAGEDSLVQRSICNNGPIKAEK